MNGTRFFYEYIIWIIIEVNLLNPGASFNGGDTKGKGT